MIKLTDEQKNIVDSDNNQIVVACPGSGKTRVLTAKLARQAEESKLSGKFVVGLTYTNRAADEIWKRIDEMGVDNKYLWIGTIHKFCLDWIVRPYMGFHPFTKKGFAVVDQHADDEIINNLKQRYGLGRWDKVNTARSRDGSIDNAGDETLESLIEDYQSYLRSNKLVNFNDLIFVSYEILKNNLNIAKTLSGLFYSFCVDEYQDTQELQYGVLEEICSLNREIKLFFVGDPDQSIYQGIGAVLRTKHELENAFDVGFDEETVSGCFRSTQRVVDYYLNFRVEDGAIDAVGENANDSCQITFDQQLSRESLIDEIAIKIEQSIEQGIPEEEICVVAPTWFWIVPISRGLKQRLPEVNFDAPGLSPFRRSTENFWFDVAKLKLIKPGPKTFNSRMRLAGSIIDRLKMEFPHLVGSIVLDRYTILRIANSISPDEAQLVPYLKIYFNEFFKSLEVQLLDEDLLSAEQLDLFESIDAQLAQFREIPMDVEGVSKLFEERTGVVVNSCHGLKGEEFETVIAFGLLWGYIPHREALQVSEQFAEESAKRLLYVICSRAKSRLHLFSEQGRLTGGGRPYVTTRYLSEVDFNYD